MGYYYLFSIIIAVLLYLDTQRKARKIRVSRVVERKPQLVSTIEGTFRGIKTLYLRFKPKPRVKYTNIDFSTIFGDNPVG